MKMYGFPATIPADKVSFLLKVLRNAFLPLYQNGRSKGLSHAEALSQMVLNKSPGFPWTYCGYGDKRTVVMTEHEKLRSFFDACEDYDCIKTTSLKDEIRPNEKVDELKTRVFIISPIEHLYVCERVFGEFVNWFHTARPTPSAVGVSPFNGDWDKVMGQFFEFAKAYGDVDGSAFDINCRSMVFELILKFVLDFIDPTLHSKAIWCFEQAIFGYTITQQGYVFRSAGHNPSGWLLTAIVNTLAMYIMLAVVFFDRYGYDDDAYNMWFEYVMAMIFGDDNVYAVDDEISHDFTPLVVLNGLNVYAPYEGSTHFKPPNGVVFLQAYSEKVDGFWVPKFLSEKCWDSLRYIPDGLSTVQRLSKYCSLLKIYWWKTDFREYLQAKCRVYISYYHNVMRGDPEWDSLVLESLKDFSCDYIPSKIPQSRVALNSRLRKHSFLMSNITKFDKQANGETKATTKQIAKMERKEHPEKKFKRLFKTVYGRGLHGSLKSHSSYYRSLIDPFNNAGAKVPNTLQFAPSGTVQCWQRFTMSGVGPQNACAAWVRPTLRASYRQINYVSPNYSWSTYSDHPAYTDVNAIVDAIKPVSMGLAFQFIGNFNNNDGEVLLAFLPGKSATAKFNFGNPSLGTPTDPYTDYLTAPFMRIIPVNQGGAFVTWRPTDYDALDFNPPSVEKWDRPDGSTILDPLGSCMIFANGLANQTLKLRVTVVTNFECIPKSNKTNFFNLTPAVNDPIEMSVIQHQMQKKLVPISTNIKTVEGVVNSSAADGGYTTNHDEGEHFSGRLYETMVPLIDGMEKLSM